MFSEEEKVSKVDSEADPDLFGTDETGFFNNMAFGMKRHDSLEEQKEYPESFEMKI